MYKRNLILLTVLLGLSMLSYGTSLAKNKSYYKGGTKKTWLAGTTWSIVNKTIDPLYSGTTGKITFSTDSFTIDSGRFAAAGIVAGSETTNPPCPIPIDPISYERIGGSLFYVTYLAHSNINPPTDIQQEAVITIVSFDKSSMVLVGQGGCGGSGMPRISILTKMDNQHPGNNEGDGDDNDNDQNDQGEDNKNQ